MGATAVEVPVGRAHKVKHAWMANANACPTAPERRVATMVAVVPVETVGALSNKSSSGL